MRMERRQQKAAKMVARKVAKANGFVEPDEPEELDDYEFENEFEPGNESESESGPGPEQPRAGNQQ